MHNQQSRLYLYYSLDFPQEKQELSFFNLFCEEACFEKYWQMMQITIFISVNKFTKHQIHTPHNKIDFQSFCYRNLNLNSALQDLKERERVFFIGLHLHRLGVSVISRSKSVRFQIMLKVDRNFILIISKKWSRV